MNLTLNNKFKIIFLLIPLNYLLVFISFNFFEFHIDIGGYILLLQILLIAYWFKNQRVLNILLIIYVLLYSLFYNTGYPFSHKVRYMLIFASTISIIWLIIKSRDQIVKISLNNGFFEVFSILFMGIFALSIVFVTPNSNEEDRLYLDGFITAHQFSYYAAILGYFWLSKKKFILGLIILVFGLLSGSRTGLILVLLAFLFSLDFKLNSKKLIILFFSAIIISSIAYISINQLFRTQLDYYSDSFGSATPSFDEVSQQKFTSYRSIIFFNFFDYFQKNYLNVYSFIGNGPKSSLSFNEAKLGVALWMHNDILDVLYCYGYIGLSLYVYFIYKLIRSTKSFFLFFFILISSIINGFMTYDVTQMLLIATIIIVEKKNNIKSDTVLTINN